MLTAFNSPRGRIAVVLRAYYDGSGEQKDPACRYVTLVAYSATDETWSKFEELWASQLKNLNIEYFHMKEAMAGKGQFSRKKGWNTDKVLRAATNFMGSLSALPRTDFIGFACTVDINGYEKAKKLLGKKVGPLEAICVDLCFGGLFHRLVRRGDGTGAPIEAFFDKDENFLHWADRVWRSKNAAKRFGWPAHVAVIAPAEMRVVRPIQAADIAAWAIRKEYEKSREEREAGDALHFAVIFSTHIVEEYYGFEEIMEKYTKLPWR